MKSHVSSILQQMTNGIVEHGNKRVDPKAVGVSAPRKKSGVMKQRWKEYRTLPRSEWTAWHLVCHFNHVHHLEFQEWPDTYGKFTEFMVFVSGPFQKTIDEGEFSIDDWCEMIEWAVKNWPEMMRRIPQFRGVTINQIYGARHLIQRCIRDGVVCDSVLKRQSEADLTTINGELWRGMEVHTNDCEIPI